jgi:hypothetical protein
MGDFIYTCVQLVHNFGAVTVVGSPAMALWLGQEQKAIQHRLAWLLVLGWIAQGVSGAGFGITSFYLKGHIPEVSGMALVALLVKIACALTGFVLAVVYLLAGSGWSTRSQLLLNRVMLGLAVIALSSAAFLRWYL